MSQALSDYDYHLPEELIAKEPLPNRSDSRMLVLDRKRQTIEHRMFREFPDFFAPGDLAVLNNSRVIRARLPGPFPNSEIFLAEQLSPGRWLCLVRPGKKWKLGDCFSIFGSTVKVEDILPGGERVLQFDPMPDLNVYGSVPLPPYLGREANEKDVTRYQNVFAERDGSVAAPTAGLHFTEEILERIPHVFATLHVGLGTFQPVKTEDVSEHHMHSERYELSEATADAINNAQRVTAVGTTVVRVLESQPDGPLHPVSGSTSIFIHPPYQFRKVDRLLTNFHLPKSTLLMLVSAMAGREFILHAYEQAVRERYRFFSYGDCMLIL